MMNATVRLIRICVCLIVIIYDVDSVEIYTTCSNASIANDLPVVTFCTNTNAIGKAIVLDGYYANANPEENNCQCTARTTNGSKLSFFHNRHVVQETNQQYCNSRIKINSNTHLYCRQVTGSVNIAETDYVSIILVKEHTPSDTRYCITLYMDTHEEFQLTCFENARATEPTTIVTSDKISMKTSTSNKVITSTIASTKETPTVTGGSSTVSNKMERLTSTDDHKASSTTITSTSGNIETTESSSSNKVPITHTYATNRTLMVTETLFNTSKGDITSSEGTNIFASTVTVKNNITSKVATPELTSTVTAGGNISAKQLLTTTQATFTSAKDTDLNATELESFSTDKDNTQTKIETTSLHIDNQRSSITGNTVASSTPIDTSNLLTLDITTTTKDKTSKSEAHMEGTTPSIKSTVTYSTTQDNAKGSSLAHSTSKEQTGSSHQEQDLTGTTAISTINIVGSDWSTTNDIKPNKNQTDLEHPFTIKDTVDNFKSTVGNTITVVPTSITDPMERTSKAVTLTTESTKSSDHSISLETVWSSFPTNRQTRNTEATQGSRSPTVKSTLNNEETTLYPIFSVVQTTNTESPERFTTVRQTGPNHETTMDSISTIAPTSNPEATEILSTVNYTEVNQETTAGLIITVDQTRNIEATERSSTIKHTTFHEETTIVPIASVTTTTATTATRETTMSPTSNLTKSSNTGATQRTSAAQHTTVNREATMVPSSSEDQSGSTESTEKSHSIKTTTDSKEGTNYSVSSVAQASKTETPGRSVTIKYTVVNAETTMGNFSTVSQTIKPEVTDSFFTVEDATVYKETTISPILTEVPSRKTTEISSTVKYTTAHTEGTMSHMPSVAHKSDVETRESSTTVKSTTVYKRTTIWPLPTEQVQNNTQGTDISPTVKYTTGYHQDISMSPSVTVTQTSNIGLGERSSSTKATYETTMSATQTEVLHTSNIPSTEKHSTVEQTIPNVETTTSSSRSSSSESRTEIKSYSTSQFVSSNKETTNVKHTTIDTTNTDVEEWQPTPSNTSEEDKTTLYIIVGSLCVAFVLIMVLLIMAVKLRKSHSTKESLITPCNIRPVYEEYDDELKYNELYVSSYDDNLGRSKTIEYIDIEANHYTEIEIDSNKSASLPIPPIPTVQNKSSQLTIPPIPYNKRNNDNNNDNLSLSHISVTTVGDSEYAVVQKYTNQSSPWTESTRL